MKRKILLNQIGQNNTSNVISNKVKLKIKDKQITFVVNP